MEEAIAGTAAGVPFVAFPPADRRPGAPTVLAWHLLDAPRTERAFAAALPMRGLDAWRVYFGLPLCGARTPDGGWDEVVRRVMADPVRNVQRPVLDGVRTEAAAALAELRERFGLADGPLAVVGGSSGAASAMLAVLDGGIRAHTAVLVNPMVDLRTTVDALSVFHGMTYEWAADTAAFTAEADLPARAAEIAATGLSVLVVTGSEDLWDAIVSPAVHLVDRLLEEGAEAAHRQVAGLGHALADEPGLEPAAQLPLAAEVDGIVTDWLTQHL